MKKVKLTTLYAEAVFDDFTGRLIGIIWIPENHNQKIRVKMIGEQSISTNLVASRQDALEWLETEMSWERG